jgi:pimeloyl-ACP methyl ester carboxylesterase
MARKPWPADERRGRQSSVLLTEEDAMSQVSTGYAPVNGLQMYYEVYGNPQAGRPLMLLHGGHHTIELSFGAVLPGLAASRLVIAAELQGHGRTADIDRPVDVRFLAEDVAALLDHLGIGQADVLGFSLGGDVAVQLAVDHPDRVGRLIPVSVSYGPDGMHEEITDPARHATSTRMPTEEDFRQMREAYARLAPDPEHFEAFMDKQTQAVAAFRGWTPDELGRITAPSLLVFGDHDFIRLEHAAQTLDRIPGAQLAVLPGTTHMTVMHRADLIVPLAEAFLS